MSRLIQFMESQFPSVKLSERNDSQFCYERWKCRSVFQYSGLSCVRLRHEWDRHGLHRTLQRAEITRLHLDSCSWGESAQSQVSSSHSLHNKPELFTHIQAQQLWATLLIAEALWKSFMTKIFFHTGPCVCVVIHVNQFLTSRWSQCHVCVQAWRVCIRRKIQSVQWVSRWHAELYQDSPADGWGRALHRKPALVSQNDGSVSVCVGSKVALTHN